MEQYPYFTEDTIELVLPKKGSIFQTKCREHVNLIVVDNKPIFFCQFDGPFIPTLRILHAFPEMMNKVRVDGGAIKFLLSGADIMCPGLTSMGGQAVMAEGKENALAIGRLKMSGDQIIKVNQGHGIESIHFLNDGLWRTPSIA